MIKKFGEPVIKPIATLTKSKNEEYYLYLGDDKDKNAVYGFKDLKYAAHHLETFEYADGTIGLKNFFYDIKIDLSKDEEDLLYSYMMVENI